MLNNDFREYKCFVKPSAQNYISQLDRLRVIQGNKSLPIPFNEVFTVFRSFRIDQEQAKKALYELEKDEVIKIINHMGVILR